MHYSLFFSQSQSHHGIIILLSFPILFPHCIMNNFFVQSITPAIVATGATIESKVDRQNAQRTKLTSTITAINMLLARCVVKTVKRRKHKKLASSTAPVLSPEPEMQRDATSISPDVPIVPSPRQCPADCPSPPRRRVEKVLGVLG